MFGSVVVCEAVSGGGSDPVPGATFYYTTTPSGLVLASPSTSTGTLVPEGYILSVPGTPAFALAPKALPGQSEFFHFVLIRMNNFLVIVQYVALSDVAVFLAYLIVFIVDFLLVIRT